MELTSKEKKLIVVLLKKNLDEVKKNEKLPNEYFADLGTEIKYDQFLTNIIKKLS
jgi:hypothetical protein